MADYNDNENDNDNGLDIQSPIITGDPVSNTEVGTWTSGDCTCTLYDDGRFTVTGNGAM